MYINSVLHASAKYFFLLIRPTHFGGGGGAVFVDVAA